MVCLKITICVESVKSEESIIIIANSSVPVEKLNPGDIQKIFLGKVIKWENGDMISIAVMKNKRIHERFLNKYVNRSPQQFENVWRRNMFTGRGSLPRKADSNKSIISYISQKKGAIGYVTGDTGLLENVKILVP